MAATRSANWSIPRTWPIASPSFAAEPVGSMARAKPSFCASLSRAGAWATGRTAPERLDLAEINAVGRQRRVQPRRHQGRGNRQVGGRLADSQSAGDVEIDIAIAEANATMRLEHREHHGEAALVPADHRPPRRAERGGGDQRLDLAQAPAGCLPCRRRPRRRGWRRSARREKAPTGWDLAEPARRHLEDADLVGGAEAVLDRPAGCGSRGRLRLRNRARHRPCVRPRGGRRSGRPW